MNIVGGEKKIIFMGSFMAKEDIKMKKGSVEVKKKGIHKFVDKVNEVTFNAKEALKQGKKVHYVTTVGVFRLTEDGIELFKVMPGIDVQKDIIENSGARILVSENLETISPDIVTGENFELKRELMN